MQLLIVTCRYGLGGPFETLSENQIRQQMEINFFGLLDVTRKAMETMRDLKTGGVIQQVTSIGGQIGKPITIHTVHASLTQCRCPQLQHLLCKQVGRRGLHRSHLERSQARMGHQVHMHRAWRFPHRLGWSIDGLWRNRSLRIRPHERQEDDGGAPWNPGW